MINKQHDLKKNYTNKICKYNMYIQKNNLIVVVIEIRHHS